MKFCFLHTDFRIKNLFVLILTTILSLSIITGSIYSQDKNTSSNNKKEEIRLPTLEELRKPKSFWDYLPDAVNRLFEPGVDISKKKRISVNRDPVKELSAIFDGETGYIKVPHNAGLNLSKNFTIEAWVKFQDSDKVQGILEKNEKGNGGYSLSISRQGYLQFYSIGEDSGRNNLFYGNSFISKDEWHHIACIFEDEKLIIYLDGQLDIEQAMEKDRHFNTMLPM